MTIIKILISKQIQDTSTTKATLALMCKIGNSLEKKNLTTEKELN